MKTIKEVLQSGMLNPQAGDLNLEILLNDLAQGLNLILGLGCVNQDTISNLLDLVTVGLSKDNDIVSSVVLDINRALGRSTKINSGGISYIHEDDSYKAVDLPPFLQKILLGPYGDRTKQLSGDYKSMISILTSYKFPSAIKYAADSVIESCFALCEEELAQQTLHIGRINFLLSRINNYHNEFSKAQALVGSPSLYTPLSAGRHNVHASSPPSFDLDMFIEACDALVAELKPSILSQYSSGSVTLPLFTSQGIMLKGKQESKRERTLSKALHALLSSKSSSMRDLSRNMMRIGEEFTSRGFVDPSLTFVMGVRKQHWKKEELVTDRESILAKTEGIQGRIRGIFPPQEAYKIKFKKKADAVKKVLFELTSCCKVDPKHIAYVINDIEERLIENNLFTRDLSVHDLKELVEQRKILDIRSFCAYDLSAFDTSQHEGLTGVYDYFMSSVFDEDANELRFSDFSLLGHIFPDSSGLRLMNIAGNSTMSGQPDVTVKNNIIHILCMAVAINKLRLDILGDDLKHRRFKDEKILQLTSISDIVKEILYSKKNIITTLIHGDDTALFLSEDIEIYKLYQEKFNMSGVSMDFERGFTYLKKEGVFFSRGKLRSDDYNIDGGLGVFIGPKRLLQPVPNSILKNRFGEYASDGLYTAIAGVLDVLILLLGHPHVAYSSMKPIIIELMFLRTVLLIDNSDSNLKLVSKFTALITLILDHFPTNDSAYVVAEDKSSMTGVIDLVRSISLELSAIIAEDVEDTISDAIHMRTLLDSVFFKHGQIGSREKADISLSLMGGYNDDRAANDEYDDDLSSLYGSLFYNPDNIEEKLGLSSASIEDIIELCKSVQGTLLDSDGDWNEVYEKFPELQLVSTKII